MSYQELLEELNSYADEKYKNFHAKLLKNDNVKVMGVKTPILRKLAKKYGNDIEELLKFPNDYYDVVFIKLTAVSNLEYEKFLKYSDYCVSLIDNWATCDCFSPKCISKHKDEYLPYIRKYAFEDSEFSQRFALTTLLHFYVEEKYAETIFSIIEQSNLNYYYVHMAVSWLIAEMLVKNYDIAKSYLMDNTLDKKTHNKAIQKACESFRLSNDRKNFLKGIKR